MCRKILIVLLLLAMLITASTVFAATLTFSGRLNAVGEYDEYQVTILGGTTVTATLVCDLEGGSRPLDPYLVVADSSNVLVAEDDDSFDSSVGGVDCDEYYSSIVTFVAPATGVYTFYATAYQGLGDEIGPYTLTVSGDGVQGSVSRFNSGDARINQQAWAPVAIFCVDGGVDIQIVTADSALVTGLTVSAEDVAAAANGSTIASSGGILLSKLSDGRLQVNAPQSDGKGYVFIWNACPMTSYEVYSLDPVSGATLTERG